MCGIAGMILQPHNRLPDMTERLTTMAQAMAHRGSDDEGVYVAPEASSGFVNRRLGLMHTNNELTSITAIDERYNATLRNECALMGYTFHEPSNTEAIFLTDMIVGQASLAQLCGHFIRNGFRFTHELLQHGETIVIHKIAQARGRLCLCEANRRDQMRHGSRDKDACRL